MKTHIALAAAFGACVVAALASTTSAQGPRLDGKWEVTTEMEMPNMPNMPAGMKMPTIASTECITPAEAKDPQKAVPPPGGRGGRGAPENCRVSDYKVDGNKVSFVMKCDGPPPTNGTGEIVYSADSYVRTIKLDRGGQQFTMKATGKRVGDCDKK